MGVTITLYTITKDNNYLDKTTGVNPINITPITIDVMSRIDNLNPVFIIAKNDIYYAANYVKDNNSRYYYITNKAVDTAGRLVLYCAIDVLQTYASEIKAATGTITRYECHANEDKGKPTLYTDTQLPVNPVDKSLVSIPMPELSGTFSADGEYSYLLTLTGGAPAVNG